MSKKFIDFYLDAVTAKKESGGGGSATLIDKNISTNGTYNASADSADGYKKVVVNVPNSYAAGDEGKVVSNGALVSQTAHAKVTQNGTIDTTLNNSVEVDVPTGGGGVEEKDVNFIDYDGELLYSYTKAEFLALSDMPANPSHSGLTAQGWNWTLSDAQSIVSACGKLTIGQMYVTDDDKTRVYIKLMDDTRLNPYIRLEIVEVAGGSLTVDWGDGSTADVIAPSASGAQDVGHAYSIAGEYMITIAGSGHITFVIEGDSTSGKQGSYLLWGGSGQTSATVHNAYRGAVYKIETGSNCLRIGDYGLYGLNHLETITLHDGMRMLASESQQFRGCNSLTGLVIPKNSVSLGSYSQAYLYNAKMISLPKQGTAIVDMALGYLTTTKCIVIHDGITSIAANAFSGNISVREYHFLSTTPPTLANVSAFTGIHPKCVIYVPYSADHSVLNAYKTATNWSTYASYIQEEPQS